MAARKSPKSKPVAPALVTAWADDSVLPSGVALLAHAASPATPSPAVKSALLARIHASRTPAHGEPAAAPAEAGWRFDSVRDPAGWFALPARGVRMKILSSDEKRDVMQFLSEIAPGNFKSGRRFIHRTQALARNPRQGPLIHEHAYRLHTAPANPAT